MHELHLLLDGRRATVMYFDNEASTSRKIVADTLRFCEAGCPTAVPASVPFLWNDGFEIDLKCDLHFNRCAAKLQTLALR